MEQGRADSISSVDDWIQRREHVARAQGDTLRGIAETTWDFDRQYSAPT